MHPRKPAASAPPEASCFRGYAKKVHCLSSFRKDNRLTFAKNWKGFAQMRKEISAPPEIGKPAKPRTGAWVQTDRNAHEAWAHLIMRKPRAATLLHILVSQMGHRNAVVVSQKTLAKMMSVTDRTIRTAVADLVSERWVQVVQLNGPGTVSAYVVNDRVAWGESRDQLHLSAFSATVIADIEDQREDALASGELRRIPTLFPGEQQLPAGPGQKPPSQPVLGGMEPDLPSIQAELERCGQMRIDTFEHQSD